MNLADYISDHIEWSAKTFGEGRRNVGLVEHIRKELDEITAKPHDVMEWIDVAILAIDGAWRAFNVNATVYGQPMSVENIAKQIENRFREKQRINLSRQWPKNTDETKPTEHIRGDE